MDNKNKSSSEKVNFKEIITNTKMNDKATRVKQRKDMENDSLKISDVLRQIRIAKNYTQVEMAEKLGMSQNGYGKIERGHTLLTLQKIKDIAKVLDINYAELLSQVEGFEEEKEDFEAVKLSEEIKQVEEKYLEMIDKLSKQHAKEEEFLKGTIKQKDTIIALLQQRIEDLQEKIRIIMFAKGNSLNDIIDMIDTYNKDPKD